MFVNPAACIPGNTLLFMFPISALELLLQNTFLSDRDSPIYIHTWGLQHFPIAMHTNVIFIVILDSPLAVSRNGSCRTSSTKTLMGQHQTGAPGKNWAVHLWTSTHVFTEVRAWKMFKLLPLSRQQEFAIFPLPSVVSVYLLVLLYFILLLQSHDIPWGLKMHESFSLPHSADALLLALTVAHTMVLFITEPRLSTTEISTGKTLITGNGKNLGFQFQGRKVSEDAGVQPTWHESWK